MAKMKFICPDHGVVDQVEKRDRPINNTTCAECGAVVTKEIA